MMAANSSLELELSQPGNILKGFANFFYLANPKEFMYKDVQLVPNIFHQSWPYFLTLITLENIVLWIQKKPLVRLNDGITSLSHAIIMESGRVLSRGAEHWAYFYIYDKFRLVDLPWDSLVTWYGAALLVDFCYYWVHRAAHEVHILWAQHQVHHSSEDYNLTIGLRQSIFYGWSSFVFYLPMALFVPPTQYIIHQYFSYLYQFWIHTETVDSLGPLEWVFNTPKHHRFHHGSNLSCLDKNYGGVLIIWDRLFGTFAESKPNLEIIYGLVYNMPSFNPVYLQAFYNKNIMNKWKAMSTREDKLSSVIKGPSWLPGKPWTGADEDKIDVQKREKYDVHLPLWLNVYLLFHFIIVVMGFQQLVLAHMEMSPLTVLLFISYILFSLTSIGLVFDNNRYSCIIESVRCLLFIVYVEQHSLHYLHLFIIIYMASFIFWFIYCLRILNVKIKSKVA